MKILQLYYKVPFPQKDGGAISIYNMSKSIMEKGFQLDILAMNQLKSPVELAAIPIDFKKETNFEVVDIDNRINYLKVVIQLFQKIPYWVSRFYSKKFEEKLIQKLENHNYDIIQLEHLYLGLYINTIRKYSNAKIVLRSQNVEYKLWEDICKTSTSFLKRNYIKINLRKLYDFERNVVNKVDSVLAITTDDSIRFKKIILSNTLLYILPAPYPVSKSLESFKTENNLKMYHLGSMDWIPNQQGIDWFLKNIVPLNGNLNFQFHIGGKNLPERYLKLRLENITFYDEVDSVKAFLEDKSVLFVPLFSGSGVRIKIIEAFANGKLVVASSKAVEGLSIINKKHFILANTALQFMEAFTLLKDNDLLQKTLRINAYDFVKNNYGSNTISSLLSEIYEEIIS